MDTQSRSFTRSSPRSCGRFHVSNIFCDNDPTFVLCSRYRLRLVYFPDADPVLFGGGFLVSFSSLGAEEIDVNVLQKMISATRTTLTRSRSIKVAVPHALNSEVLRGTKFTKGMPNSLVSA